MLKHRAFHFVPRGNIVLMRADSEKPTVPVDRGLSVLDTGHFHADRHIITNLILGMKESDCTLMIFNNGCGGPILGVPSSSVVVDTGRNGFSSLPLVLTLEEITQLQFGNDWATSTGYVEGDVLHRRVGEDRVEELRVVSVDPPRLSVYDFSDALRLIREGQSMRITTWPKGVYVALGTGNRLTWNFVIDMVHTQDSDWVPSSTALFADWECYDPMQARR